MFGNQKHELQYFASNKHKKQWIVLIFQGPGHIRGWGRRCWWLSSRGWRNLTALHLTNFGVSRGRVIWPWHFLNLLSICFCFILFLGCFQNVVWRLQGFTRVVWALPMLQNAFGTCTAGVDVGTSAPSDSRNAVDQGIDSAEAHPRRTRRFLELCSL